ncbi:MAG TPA: peptidyl-alpha-hydroxyglycine alpha-amidating lyase family protein [Vicinamibacterales bacterium]|nr:peptidyl-alpha-hydroxyglycine alpha-amidating lyase family protein [Vicinamibacterales bacterium]
MPDHGRRIALAFAGLICATALTAAQPNPYRTIEGWATMPEGRKWGATSAVDIDKDGRSIWVAERCGANSCLGSELPVVLKFDETGKLVRSFGAGMMIFPHGIHVDRDGNVWVTDGQDNKPRRARGAPPDTPLPPPPDKLVGHQVFKFSPEGELLLTLGVAGGGTGRDGFFQPNDVVTAPNGNIYVAEGHGGDNARIVVFDPRGGYLREFGKKGTGPVEFDQPHALAFDSKGRLFVGDRSNNRIQILDQDGRFLEEWTQFSRPSGIYIDKRDMIYVADSESGSVGNGKSRTDWKRGIRIGSISDGKVIALIPDPNEKATNTSAAEGVAADDEGNVYGAEVGPRALKKYVKAGS